MISIFSRLIALSLLVSAAVSLADAGAPFTDPKTGLTFQYAGDSLTAAGAADLCKALPGTVPANRYFLSALWHGWSAFQAAQKPALNECLVLSPFSDEAPVTPGPNSETCVSMNGFGYYAFHEPRPVICVATQGQKAVWLDQATGQHWSDIGLVTSEADAKTKCRALGARWRLADVLDNDTVAKRIRDSRLNPDLKVDPAGCYVVTYAGTSETSPTCADFRYGAYLAHFPTRALCVQDIAGDPL